MSRPTMSRVGPKEISSVARNPRPSSIGRALTSTLLSSRSLSSSSSWANAGRTVSKSFADSFSNFVSF